MLRHNLKILDTLLVGVLIIVAGIVVFALMLPEPPADSASPATLTPSVTPTPEPTATMRPLAEAKPEPPTPTQTSTPSVTATPTRSLASPTPHPTAPPGSTETPLPLIARGATLPHDALFIRRHNDFALQSTSGIENLIEAGISITETPVKFDTFIPLNGSAIPEPEDSISLAVRYGFATIPKLGSRDQRATHYLEIALQTQDEIEPEGLTLPVNYVFAVDTSGSMEGAKIRGVRTAIGTLFEAMRPQDTLGIIDFDVQARTVLPARQVGEITQGQLNQSLNQLIAEGGTDINLGLTAGITEAIPYAGGQTLSHIFLFSDGNATDGVTEWLTIRENIVNALRERPITISTFAFGEDANARELDALAGVTGGTHTLVTDPTQLGLDLEEELARREHVVAKDIEITVEIDPSILILRIYGHDQVEEPIARAALEESGSETGPSYRFGRYSTEKGIQVLAPDLVAGDTYWIILELAIDQERFDPVGSVRVQYTDVPNKREQETDVSLSWSASNSRLLSDLVMKHAVSSWSAEVALYTLDDIKQDDVETAQARLSSHITQLEMINRQITTTWLAEDIVIFNKILILLEQITSGNLSRQRTGDARALLTYALKAFGQSHNGVSRIDLSEP